MAQFQTEALAARRARMGAVRTDIEMVGREGVEPATLGLKVPCSTS